MGRSPCCSKEGLNRGAWTKKEDMILSEYIRIHGDGGWRNLPKKAGLKRCGKSCRLRWLNYLRPDIKRGNIRPDEEELIIRLHRLLGNRWSLIAGRLPGRTDNEIKNYWNTHLSKKLSLNESQHKTSQNFSSSSKSPVLVQDRVFRASAFKITTAVRPSEVFKLSTIKETTDSTRRDLLVKDSITDDEPEGIPFARAANLTETEATAHSTSSMSSLGDYFAGDADTLAGESSLYLKELSSPGNYLFPTPSDCSTDFASQVFNRGQATLAKETNGFEGMLCDQSNIQGVKSFTVADDRETEEYYNSAQHADWIPELDYLENSSAQLLSFLLLESEDEWEERVTWNHSSLEDPVQFP